MTNDKFIILLNILLFQKMTIFLWGRLEGIVPTTFFAPMESYIWHGCSVYTPNVTINC